MIETTEQIVIAALGSALFAAAVRKRDRRCAWGGRRRARDMRRCNRAPSGRDARLRITGDPAQLDLAEGHFRGGREGFAQAGAGHCHAEADARLAAKRP